MTPEDRCALSDIPSELRRLYGQTASYSVLWKAAVEGAFPAERVRNRWYVRRADLPRQKARASRARKPTRCHHFPGRPPSSASPLSWRAARSSWGESPRLRAPRPGARREDARRVGAFRYGSFFGSSELRFSMNQRSATFLK